MLAASDRFGIRATSARPLLYTKHGSVWPLLKYLHNLIELEENVLEIIRSFHIGVYFFSLSTYISGGNLFRAVTNVNACKSPQCCLEEFKFQ